MLGRIRIYIPGLNPRFSYLALRKQAYSNILNILPPRDENFQIKIQIIFLISSQNIDCGYSLEPPRHKKNNVYPCKPQFYCIKVGFKGVKIIKVCFRDVCARIRWKLLLTEFITTVSDISKFKGGPQKCCSQTKLYIIYTLVIFK